MIIIQLTLFISTILLLLLIFYPIYVWIYSLIDKKTIQKTKSFIQPVSIIIACYNEEKYIRKKIESFLDKDEWIDGSEIIVVSNGSTDLTNSILLEFESNSFIKIIILDEASKILSLNIAVKESKHEILLFSDCRQVMKKGSVKNLINNFSDSNIGTVSATLKGEYKDKFSLRCILNFISSCESKFDSSLNVFGALYAQRKSVYREIPQNLLCDDLFVVVSTINQKRRLITDSEAIIYDVPFTQYYSKDRIRRLTRGLLIFFFSHFMFIFKLPFSELIRFLIFKYLKLLLPFILLTICFDIAYLSYNVIPIKYIYFAFTLILLLFIFTSSRKLLSHFISINYHFFIGFLLYVFGKNRSNKWNKLHEERINS